MPCCWSSMSRDVLLLLSGSKLCLAKLFRSNSFNSTARHWLVLIDGWCRVQGAEEEVEDDESAILFRRTILPFASKEKKEKRAKSE